jgi:hypothetical protein
MHGGINVIEAEPEPTKLPFEPSQQIWLSIIIVELSRGGKSSNHAIIIIKRSGEEDAAHQVSAAVLPKRYHEVLEPK